MAANVGVAVKFAMNNTIGICVKENVSVAVKLRQNNTIGMVASVPVEAKHEMNNMIGKVQNVMLVEKLEILIQLLTNLYFLILHNNTMRIAVSACWLLIN